MLQKGQVGRIAGVSAERLEERRDRGAESERVEGDLENVVQLLDGLRGELQGVARELNM